MNSADRQRSKKTPLSDDTELTTGEVLMIGCGRMGSALLSQWQRSPAFRFTTISPSGTRDLGADIRQRRGATELAGQRFDIIVIAVKPQMIAEVLPEYLPHLAPGGVFVSIAAGFSCRSLASICDNQAVVRVMPNLPVALGKGVSGLYADKTVADEHRKLVERLMQATGHLIWVDSEDELDRVTAVAGSGPGNAFEIARCWAEAGESLGFSPAQSRDLVLKTLEGAVDLALASDSALGDLRERVTSKNGTTQAGLFALNGDAQLDGLLRDTVKAAYERAVELR
jgi:pyrroline-5-carboxylate reductase